MSLVIALLCILFLGAVLLLVTLNHALVDVNLFLRSYEQVPIAVVMVIALLTGLVFASFIGILDGIRIRLQNRRLRKRVIRLEDELEAVRRLGDSHREEGEVDPSPPMDYPS